MNKGVDWEEFSEDFNNTEPQLEPKKLIKQGKKKTKINLKNLKRRKLSGFEYYKEKLEIYKKEVYFLREEMNTLPYVSLSPDNILIDHLNQKKEFKNFLITGRLYKLMPKIIKIEKKLKGSE